MSVDYSISDATIVHPAYLNFAKVENYFLRGLIGNFSYYFL